MTDAYRDPDRSELANFAQHIAIAEGLLSEFNSYPGRVQAMFKAGQVPTDTLERVRVLAASAWERLWEQLVEARAIAKRLGRDVSVFDECRSRAGNIWMKGAEFDVGSWRGSGQHRTRLVTWRAAPNEPARGAIKALRAAIPEVVIARPRNDEPAVDLAPRRLWPWIMLAALLALAVWRIAA
jgi:hypothetical protein